MNTHNSCSKGPLNPSSSFKNLGLCSYCSLTKKWEMKFCSEYKSVEALLFISAVSRFHSRNSPDEFSETLADLDHWFPTMVQHFLWMHELLEPVMALPGGGPLSGTETASLIAQTFMPCLSPSLSAFHRRVWMEHLITLSSTQWIMTPSDGKMD